MKYELIENLLNKEVYDKIANHFNSNYFPWFYQSSTVLGVDNNFMFAHHLYKDGKIVSEFYNDILPILFKASIVTEKFYLLRVKANLYTNQKENIYHAVHTDYPNYKNYKTAVYNFTECNGGTVLNIDDKEITVPSKENSLLVFDGIIPHQGFTQTDKNTRVILNIDFI